MHTVLKVVGLLPMILFVPSHDSSIRPIMALHMSGVVEYVSRDDMKAAIRTLDDTRLGGKYIRVREVRYTSMQLYMYIADNMTEGARVL